MTILTRYIPHRQFLIYLWAGWEIGVIGGPHARHSFLATREPVT